MPQDFLPRPRPCLGPDILVTALEVDVSCDCVGFRTLETQQLSVPLRPLPLRPIRLPMSVESLAAEPLRQAG